MWPATGGEAPKQVIRSIIGNVSDFASIDQARETARKFVETMKLTKRICHHQSKFFGYFHRSNHSHYDHFYNLQPSCTFSSLVEVTVRLPATAKNDWKRQVMFPSVSGHSTFSLDELTRYYSERTIHQGPIIMCRDRHITFCRTSLHRLYWGPPVLLRVVLVHG